MLPTIVLSIDDLYLPYHAQCDLAASKPGNPLLQHRGQPSTHDLPLARSLFSNLRNGLHTGIPGYDKSAFNGSGDRVPEEQWATVNKSGQPRIKIVILEGWCVGFRALTAAELQAKWEDAVSRREKGDYEGCLGRNRLEDVTCVNDALKGYDVLTDQLDILIHLDAAHPLFVYQWRLQQEKALRESRGSGMTDDQVMRFVSDYYPAYELYTDGLRAGVMARPDEQLRLIIEKDRSVREIIRL